MSLHSISVLAIHAATSGDCTIIARKQFSLKNALLCPLSEVSRIVRRVHDHVCGPASFGDICTLLQRDNI